MITFSGNHLLLDIEGTTSSISFVYDVMFPFVRRELDAFLKRRWLDDELASACELLARDAGAKSFHDWCDGACDSEAARRRVRDEVVRQMDADLKTTGLKRLQGMIWHAGFASGELVAHVYEDVPPALRQWQASGKQIRIYSSGSIAAQQLFFGHTSAGNLLPLLRGHYDTTLGSKKDPQSYAQIVADAGAEPSDMLFLSDVVAELDAAREAGLQTGLCVRPGNAPVEDTPGHPALHSFEEIR